MRVANWNIKEALVDEKDRVIQNGNNLMDEVVQNAKALCPVGKWTREGKFVTAKVKFVRSRGKGNYGKGTIAEFEASRWTGRQPGTLRETIRRKTIGGSVRVYAGNFKVYYSLWVERGSVHNVAKPFLRPSFFAVKQVVVDKLTNGGKV